MANRHVKSNFLLQSLSPDEMKTGISAEQLRSIAEGIVRECGTRGQDFKNALQNLVTYLTTSPGKGKMVANFQEETHGSEDSCVLHSFLFDYYKGINVNPYAKIA